MIGVIRVLLTMILLVSFNTQANSIWSDFKIKSGNTHNVKNENGTHLVIDYNLNETYYVERRTDNQNELVHYKSKIVNPKNSGLFLQGKTSERLIKFNIYYQADFSHINLYNVDYMIFKLKEHNFIAFKQDFELFSETGMQTIRIGDTEDILYQKTDFIDINVKYDSNEGIVSLDKGYKITKHEILSDIFNSDISYSLNIESEFYSFNKTVFNEHGLFTLKKTAPKKRTVSISQISNYLGETKEGLKFHIRLRKQPAHTHSMIRTTNYSEYLNLTIVSLNNFDEYWRFEDSGKSTEIIYLQSRESKRKQFY